MCPSDNYRARLAKRSGQNTGRFAGRAAAPLGSGQHGDRELLPIQQVVSAGMQPVVRVLLCGDPLAVERLEAGPRAAVEGHSKALPVADRGRAAPAEHGIRACELCSHELFGPEGAVAQRAQADELALIGIVSEELEALPIADAVERRARAQQACIVTGIANFCGY